MTDSQKLDLLLDGVAELKAGQQRLEERQGKLEERQGRLEQRQGKLEERQGRLEERQGKLEERQEKLEERQERFEERQERFEERQGRFEERQGRFEGKQEDLERVQLSMYNDIKDIRLHIENVIDRNVTLLAENYGNLIKKLNKNNMVTEQQEIYQIKMNYLIEDVEILKKEMKEIKAKVG